MEIRVFCCNKRRETEPTNFHETYVHVIVTVHTKIKEMVRADALVCLIKL